MTRITLNGEYENYRWYLHDATGVPMVALAYTMNLQHALYPEYGFAEHKGYATLAHLNALARLGPSPIHRESFAPVRASLQAQFWPAEAIAEALQP